MASEFLLLITLANDIKLLLNDELDTENLMDGIVILVIICLLHKALQLVLSQRAVYRYKITKNHSSKQKKEEKNSYSEVFLVISQTDNELTKLTNS